MSNEYVETIGIRKDVRVFERKGSLHPVGIGINKTVSGMYINEPHTTGYNFVILSIEEAEKLVEHINNIINKTRRQEMNLREEKLQLEQRLREIEEEINKDLVFLVDDEIAVGTSGAEYLRLGVKIDDKWEGQPEFKGYTYTLLTKDEAQDLINELTKYVED